jgi:hypothetical protein
VAVTLLDLNHGDREDQPRDGEDKTGEAGPPPLTHRNSLNRFMLKTTDNITDWPSQNKGGGDVLTLNFLNLHAGFVDERLLLCYGNPRGMPPLYFFLTQRT